MTSLENSLKQELAKGGIGDFFRGMNNFSAVPKTRMQKYGKYASYALIASIALYMLSSCEKIKNNMIKQYRVEYKDRV